jgi:hypothetical protein
MAPILLPLVTRVTLFPRVSAEKAIARLFTERKTSILEIGYPSTLKRS